MISNLTIANAFSSATLSGPSGIPNPNFASGIANVGMLTVRNCNIRGCATEPGSGHSVYNSGTMEMDNCRISEAGRNLPSNTDFDQTDGGAIYNLGTLQMNSCIITNCRARHAGGFYNLGSATLTGCMIESCSVWPECGWAAGRNTGHLTMSGCLVADNYADYIGGIGSSGTVTMTNTTITGNLGEGDGTPQGGGLELDGGVNLLYGCTISGNQTESASGGGIKNNSTLTMLNCTVNGNICFGTAGGIYNLNTLTMTNCTVSGNRAPYVDTSVGGVANGAGAAIYLSDCTVVSNIGYVFGGITNAGGTVFAQDTLVAGNTSNDFSGVLISQGNNLIQNTNGCTLTGVPDGNIYGFSPLIGPLQNNGGRTWTHALLAGSPAIDAGPTNAAPQYDQRGAARPFGLADDIGAFEYGSPVFEVAPNVLSVLPTLNGCFQIRFGGNPGADYLLQRSASLSGPWATIIPVIAGPDGYGNWVDTYPPSIVAFYRVTTP